MYGDDVTISITYLKPSACQVHWIQNTCDYPGYPTQIFKEKSSELFQVAHREHSYYTAALALYRLELNLGNYYIPRDFQKYKWHLLMIVKYQIAGFKKPGLGNKKLDKYCDKIIDSLAAGGKGSAIPFQKAIEVIESVGLVTRDRLKRQVYTKEILDKLQAE